VIFIGDVFLSDKNQKEIQEERAKQMAKVVCICKGINLGRVLAGIEGCQTVQDVNRKVGTGSGGCQGQRCGPRIKALLDKIKQSK
jgi:hypothetical protein